MEEKQELTCRDCGNVEVIYYCKKLGANIIEERKLNDCPHSHNWERGDALYIWYCPKCGNQLLAIRPPEKCPNCGEKLGRKNVR